MTKTSVTIADVVADFDKHLGDGHVYLVNVFLPMQDKSTDSPINLTVDVYLIAVSWWQAEYIAKCMYPDATSVITQKEPLDRLSYATRRNRSIL